MPEIATEVVDKATGEILALDKRDRSLVFGTLEPERIIQRAAQVAERLTDIIEKSNLYVNIEGRKYVKAEGWAAMIAMLGVFPTSVWCNRLDRNKDEITYDAKIVLKHFSGTVVGEGQAIASNLETVKTRDGRIIPKPWTKDEFSVKSMAQTRAVGKACRLSFSWIMALAKYEACPYEEMDSVKSAHETTIEAKEPTPAEIDAGEEIMTEKVAAKPPPIELGNPPLGAEKRRISEKQTRLLWFLMKQAKIPEAVFNGYIKDTFQVSQTKDLDRAEMDTTMKWIQRFQQMEK